MSIPALKTRMSDLLVQYVEQSEALAAAVEAYREAGEHVVNLACVGAAYAGTPLDPAWKPNDREISRVLLKSAWARARQISLFDKVAPATDRDKMDTRLTDPPEFTIENLRKLFGETVADPHGATLRGLAEQFSALDPAFRSHTKVRIGVKGLPKRVILRGPMAGYYGRDRIGDILRAVDVVRGVPGPSRGDIFEIYDGMKAGRDVERHGITCRGFSNGNVHLLFAPQPLRAVNEALAEFYGDVLPDADRDDVAPAKGTAVSADLAYYPTPKAVCDALLGEAYISGRILEPSCGDGRIMDALQRGRGNDRTVVGIEVDARRAAQARAKGHSVRIANFLEVEPTGDFDLVVMNPPFAGQHWQKHVAHALKFLRPRGKLLCILPASAEITAVETFRGNWRNLPLRSFAESGTNVSTGILSAFAP